jgi:Ca2+-binding EF-hand superfamily protein
MRVNPKLANLQYMYATDDTASGLPEGTYSNMAATKYVKDNDKNKDKCLTSDEVTLSKEAFDKLDADKNGKIDLKEMKAGLWGQDDAIKTYYKNKKSGSKDDLASLVGGSSSALAGTYANLAAAKFVKENDKNKDDKLSAGEAGLSKTAFDRLDTNKDGELDADEIRAGLYGQENTVAAFYENNGTGSSVTNTLASLLEKPKPQTAGTYSTKAAASFISANDKNGDGGLSSAEAALSTASFDKLDADKNGSLSQAEIQAATKAKEDAFKIYYGNNVSSRVINGLTSSLLKTI